MNKLLMIAFCAIVALFCHDLVDSHVLDSGPVQVQVKSFGIKSFFGLDRYAKINNHLLKHSKSDKLEDILSAASDWFDKLNERKEGKKLSKGEIRLLSAVEDLLKLDKIPDDGYCTPEVQELFARNDRNTNGHIYKCGSSQDRYAVVLRHAVLKRAEKCQETYTEALDKVQLDEGFAKSLSTYDTEFVTKMVKRLQKKNKYAHFKVKSIRDDRTGGLAQVAIDNSCKVYDDNRGQELFSYGISDFGISSLVRTYLVSPAHRFLSTMPALAFESAVMDARAAGRGKHYSWMDSANFMKNIDIYLVSKQVVKEEAYLNKVIKSMVNSNQSGHKFQQ